MVYGITSPAEGAAGARRLLGIVRERWRIESGLRDVRDVTVQEDACRARKGNAPPVPAALGNAVVHRLSRSGPEEEGLSRAGILRRLGARPPPRPCKPLASPRLKDAIALG